MVTFLLEAEVLPLPSDTSLRHLLPFQDRDYRARDPSSPALPGPSPSFSERLRRDLGRTRRAESLCHGQVITPPVVSGGCGELQASNAYRKQQPGLPKATTPLPSRPPHAVPGSARSCWSPVQPETLRPASPSGATSPLPPPAARALRLSPEPQASSGASPPDAGWTGRGPAPSTSTTPRGPRGHTPRPPRPRPAS